MIGLVRLKLLKYMVQVQTITSPFMLTFCQLLFFYTALHGYCPFLIRVHRHFCFQAKIAFFACFPSVRNIEVWIKTKMKRSKNKTKRSKNWHHFRLGSKMKRRGSKIVFASMRKKCFFTSEAKRKWNEAKTKMKKKRKLPSKKDKVKFWDNL